MALLNFALNAQQSFNVITLNYILLLTKLNQNLSIITFLIRFFCFNGTILYVKAQVRSLFKWYNHTENKSLHETLCYSTFNI